MTTAQAAARLYIVTAATPDGRRLQFVALAESEQAAQDAVRQEQGTDRASGGAWTLTSFPYRRRTIYMGPVDQIAVDLFGSTKPTP